MDLNRVDLWIDVLSGVFVLVAGLATAFRAYIRHVLERVLLPPAQFEVEFHIVGFQKTDKIVEVLLHMSLIPSTHYVASQQSSWVAAV